MALELGYKRIADPVHGTIPLTRVEVAVIEAAAFQRLRNVKHLGLVHYVFPGADFSRFSHGVGTCHVAGQVLDSLQHRYGQDRVPDEVIQRYRLAALLHDIGHYPFSHTYEDAIQAHYDDLILPEDEETGGLPPSPLKHEEVSSELVHEDSEIRHTLDDYQIDIDDVANAFLGQEVPPVFGNLITSDLDADRIDYLLRTALHTGLPYGSVDLDYLVAQIRLDDDGMMCLAETAIHTAEHLLLGRYFDRQTTAFHKTVAGLEWILTEVIRTGLRLGEDPLPWDGDTVRGMVQNGAWRDFDDVAVFSAARRIYSASEAESPDRLKAEALLTRNPPKLLTEFEWLARRDERPRALERVGSRETAMQAAIEELSDRFEIDRSLFHLWSLDEFSLTKFGRLVVAGEDIQDEELLKSVHVVSRRGGTAQAIMTREDSLIASLSQYGLYSMRLYVLLPKEQWELRDDMRTVWAKIASRYRLPES